MIASGTIDPPTYCGMFIDRLTAAIQAAANDPEVVGFKSIVCYRTGLDVSPNVYADDTERTLMMVVLRYEMTKKLRLADKPLNDMIVVTTLRIAAQCGKPGMLIQLRLCELASDMSGAVQFHTGLGDNDIILKLSSPSHMQPLIKAFPQSKFVLLHSSYPYTREAGYLTANYPNVWLDFGEVFPCLSAEGQRNVVRQVLELAPTSKILWSSAYISKLSACRSLIDMQYSGWSLVARVVLPWIDSGSRGSLRCV